MHRRRSSATTFDFVDSFHNLKSDFRMAEESRFHSRLKGVSAAGSGADYHYRNERQWLHMLERARHYRRDDQVVGQGVRRLVANIIQDGFNLDVQTGDDAINQDLKARWDEWSSDPDQCHSEQELTFPEIERLALDNMLTDGDVLLLPLQEGSLQPIEAHRLRTPRGTTRNVVHGVLLDERARRKEYWITKEDLGLQTTVSRVSEIEKYAARDDDGYKQVLHLYEPFRFSQRRGVTALAPISFTVGCNDDVQFATLVKQQMGALIAILREREPGWVPPAMAAQAGPQQTEEICGYTKTIEGMSAGMEVAGDPGEKLSMFSANVPGPGFKEHSLMILTFIAINLDLPVAVLLLDPSLTNFSGWRGAVDQARQRWRQIQAGLIAKLHCPTYRWKVRQWIAQDPALRAAAQNEKLRIFGHVWNPPRWPYIEPLKDAQADQLQDTQLLSSKRRLQAARGRDWDEISSEIVADNVAIIRKALRATQQLNHEFPEARLDWREVLRLPATAAPASAVQQEEDATADAPQQDK